MFAECGDQLIVPERNLMVFERRAARVLAPGRTARLLALVRRRALDRRLMDGADPSSSGQLAARAATLTNRATRTRIAEGLERLLSLTTEAPPRRWYVPPAARAVRANEAELSELVGLLRGSRPLYARGVAMLSDLLVDGTGPAYTDGRGGTLAVRLCGAREALGA